jgi:hypothetical protein
MACFGVPEYVICNGRVCVDEGQVKVLQGYGNFVTNPANASFVYELVNQREKVPYTLESCIYDPSDSSFHFRA